MEKPATLIVLLTWISVSTPQNSVIKVYGIHGYGITLYCNPNDVSKNAQFSIWETPEEAIIPPFYTDDFKQEGAKLVMKKALVLYSGVYKCKFRKSDKPYLQELIVMKSQGYLLRAIPVVFPAKKLCVSGENITEVPSFLRRIWCTPINDQNSNSCFLRIEKYGCLDNSTYSYNIQPTIVDGYMFSHQCLDPECLIKDFGQHAEEVIKTNKLTYRIKIGKYFRQSVQQYSDLIPEQAVTEAAIDAKACADGFEKSEVSGNLCVPCAPGMYSNQDTSHSCEECDLGIYARIYGQADCVGLKHKPLGYIPPDYADWKKPNNITRIYALVGDIEVLRCNPDEVASTDKADIPVGISFKWKLPIGLSNFSELFQETDDLLVIKKGDVNINGIYSCSVKFEFRKEYTYNSEVVFVPKTFVASNLVLTFPNHFCSDDVKNKAQMNKLVDIMQKIWAYPYIDKYSVFKLDKKGCVDSNYYEMKFFVECWKNFRFSQCRSLKCLVKDVKSHIKSRLNTAMEIYRHFVTAYLQESQKKFQKTFSHNITLPIVKPIENASCTDGFQVEEVDNFTMCIPCPPGHFSIKATNSSKQICRKCVSGFYQEKSMQSKCERCPQASDETRTKCVNKKIQILQGPLNETSGERELIKSLTNYKLNAPGPAPNPREGPSNLLEYYIAKIKYDINQFNMNTITIISVVLGVVNTFIVLCFYLHCKCGVGKKRRSDEDMEEMLAGSDYEEEEEEEVGSGYGEADEMLVDEEEEER